MEESWEEKTERLEREYQARIDRLREELRDMEEQKLHMGSLFEERVRQHEQIEYTNAALTKRVAELEHEVMMLRGSIAARDEISERHLRVREELAQQVLDLQSQIAWTPVSAGLPTGPGLYEFHHVSSPHLAPLKLCELRTDGVWEDEDEDSWPSDDFWRYAAMHTHFRKVTLP